MTDDELAKNWRKTQHTTFLIEQTVSSGGTSMIPEITDRRTKEVDGVGFFHEEAQGGCSARVPSTQYGLVCDVDVDV